jgi:hypothetical protein
MVTVLYTNHAGFTWLARCSNTNAQRVISGGASWLPIDPAVSQNDDNSYNFHSGDMYENVTIPVSRIIQINTI